MVRVSDEQHGAALEQSTEQQADGRTRLLAATVKVVSQLGLRGMTFRAVAAEAKVNNTLITYHFGSRNALLIAAMDWAVERTSAQTSAAAAITRPDSFAAEITQMVLQDPDLQVFQYEMLFESRRVPEIRESVSALYERYITQIARALTERGYEQAERRARVVFAALDGLVLQQLTIASAAEISECLSLVGEMFATEQ